MPFLGFREVECSDQQLGWNCFDIAVGMSRGVIDRDPALVFRTSSLNYLSENEHAKRYTLHLGI